MNPAVPTILIAEDSPTTSAILRAQLEEWGYSVTETRNGNEAWNVLQADNPPRIALLDWIMPGMNGIELCRQLKAYEGVPYTYIILITALSQNLQKEDIILAGADDVLIKPINVEELKLRLHVAQRVIYYDNILCAKNRELSDQNKQLIELSAFKNKLLGIVAHDLRNPIISVRGLSELFLNNLSGPLSEDQRNLINLMHSVSENMLELVNDLLDVSVIESGTLELKSLPSDLNEVVRSKMNILKVIASQKNIEMIFMPDFTLPLTDCDAARMGQAIENLISNALKFSNQNTKVEINTYADLSNVFISIRDEGPGISNEDQEKLFTEFQTLQNRPTGGESSTGLGLALTKKIVQLHHGQISVVSQPGKGSTFTLSLPLSKRRC